MHRNLAALGIAAVSALIPCAAAPEDRAPHAPETETRNGALPPPLPLFPPDNWWNVDISGWPVDANSASYINFINQDNGGCNRLHPDFGGLNTDDPPSIYGMPFIVVDEVPRKA